MKHPLVLSLVFLWTITAIGCSDNSENTDPTSPPSSSATNAWKLLTTVPTSDSYVVKGFAVPDANGTTLFAVSEIDPPQDLPSPSNTMDAHLSTDLGQTWTTEVVNHPTLPDSGETVSRLLPDLIEPNSFYFLTHPSIITNSSLIDPIITLRRVVFGSGSSQVISSGTRSYFSILEESDSAVRLYRSQGISGGHGTLDLSVDGGASWTDLVESFPRWQYGDDYMDCSVWGMSAHEDGSIIFGCFNTPYLSRDFGSNWIQLPSPDGDWIGGEYLIHPLDSDEIFFFDTRNTQLHKLTFGESSAWETRALPDDVNAVYLSPTDINTLYSVQANGVSMSNDSGLSWQTINNGIEGLSADELFLIDDAIYLRSGDKIYIYQ